MFRTLLSVLTALLGASMPATAQWDVSGSLELELRMFPQDPAHDGQEDATFSPSAAFQPELVYEWGDGNNRLTFEPFARWDADDSRRSHFDMREANYLHLEDTWDVLIGMSRVFWGVTESVHLVDIINQTDFVEDLDNEDKLGQPMINLNLLRDSGTYSFFVLPGFRERTFPGDDARRRGPVEIDPHKATYDSGAENGHVDFAFRWSQVFGNWDVGVSHFYGTSREPRLKPRLKLLDDVSLRPHYDLINQTGLDVQYTAGAWLWKLEAMSRWGQGGQFFAAVGGFEYTRYQAFDSEADLGLLLEYQFDDRDENEAPVTLSDHDVFVGARYSLNDESSTMVLGGLVVDVTNGSTAAFLEAERRLSNHWKAELEARLFLHSGTDDFLAAFERDDSVSLKMTYSF
jgi:hypothetical protein